MHEDINIYNCGSVNLPSKVVLSGISYCDGSYVINRPNSNCAVLEYIIKGKGTVCCDGQKFTALAGDTYYLPYRKNQFYYSDSADPWVKIFFNIDGGFIDNLATEYGIAGKYLFKNCEIQELMHNVIDISKKNLSPYDIQQESLLQIQRIIMKIYENERKLTDFPEELNILKSYIEKNAVKNITLDELSCLIYRSKNYVLNIFNQYLNTTPYNYYLNAKMNIAEKLLVGTNMPIQKISDYLGFDNPHYFSSRFKKKFGAPPSDYRKNKNQRASIK